MVATFGPALAALTVTAISGGWTGLRDLMRCWFRWRASLGWYLAAVLIPVITLALGMGLYVAIGGNVPKILLPSPGKFALQGVVIILFFGPMGEEPGWRGFALPRLLDRWSSLIASVILGSLWALWHLPLVLMPGSAHAHYGFGWFSVAVMSFTLIITRAFLGSGGVLVIAILFHASVNIFWPLAPSIVEGGTFFHCVVIASCVVALLAIIVGRGCGRTL